MVASRKRAIAQFQLGRHLPHLLRRAHFEAEARFVDVYGPEITSRQLALLVSVAQHGPLSQAEVARRIGLDANTCSDLVRRAVQRGWLLRRADPADARARVLELSVAGLQVVEHIALPGAAPYADAVAGRLTAAEGARLVALLRKLLGLHDEPPG